MTVTTGYGDQFVKVWIDYNNDLAFTEDEVIINNYEIADGEAGGSHTETINFTIPENANLGEHILRAKTNWGAEVPIDPCTETDYGETEDYTVIIQEASLGIIDNATNKSKLSLSHFVSKKRVGIPSSLRSFKIGSDVNTATSGRISSLNLFASPGVSLRCPPIDGIGLHGS